MYFLLISVYGAAIAQAAPQTRKTLNARYDECESQLDGCPLISDGATSGNPPSTQMEILKISLALSVFSHI